MTENIMHILTNVLGTYTIYEFMMIFFEPKKKSKSLEWLSYIAYFIIASILYLFFNAPIVMILFNIVMYIVISLNYKGTFKKRMLAIGLIYLVSLCIETIVVLVFLGLNLGLKEQHDYVNIYVVIMARIVIYIVALLLRKFTSIKRGEMVSPLYWINITLMPLGTFYILIVFMKTEKLSNIDMVISLSFLLLINFGTFYLYEVISKFYNEQIEKQWIVQQNRYYGEQFELMKSSIHATRTLKHDWKNHLITLYALVEKKQDAEALKHINNMMEVCEPLNEYARSGNIIIDSILNFKIQEALQQGIVINTEINIPEDIKVEAFDMSVILGNILDNAFQAVNKIDGERYINMQVKYSKGRLLIKIENPFIGTLIMNKETLQTTHVDKKNHGIGLQSVKSILEKYEGSIDIKTENNIFTNYVLMYIE